MALELPVLAEKKFEQLLNDLVTSVPKYAENWDNFNPSDVGMTLLELMSFAGEATLYRLDKISKESYLNFLRLVTGAKGKAEVEASLGLNQSALSSAAADKAHRRILEFQLEVEAKAMNQALSSEDIPRIKKEVMKFTSSRYRVVTKDDFEALALESTEEKPGGSAEKVARAIIEESAEKKGKVWIYVVADRGFTYEDVDLSIFEFGLPWKTTRISGEVDFSSMVNDVYNYLQPRKLIGTPVEVAIPSFTPFYIEAEVVFASTPKAKRGLVSIKKEILRFFDPVHGGEKGDGWPYQRLVSIYEISQIIENVSDVDHVKSLALKDSSGVVHNQLPMAGLARLDELIVTPLRSADE